MWLLHHGLEAAQDRGESLEQQIVQFSSAVFDAIGTSYPMLRNAGQERLWLIYFKALLNANTHPHEEMLPALRNICYCFQERLRRFAPALETTWRDREAYFAPHFSRRCGSFKADRPRFRAIQQQAAVRCDGYRRAANDKIAAATAFGRSLRLAVPELKPLPVVAELADIPAYLPFQFGVRLLRKASIPSRKSSLI